MLLILFRIIWTLEFSHKQNKYLIARQAFTRFKPGFFQSEEMLIFMISSLWYHMISIKINISSDQKKPGLNLAKACLAIKYLFCLWENSRVQNWTSFGKAKYYKTKLYWFGGTINELNIIRILINILKNAQIFNYTVRTTGSWISWMLLQYFQLYICMPMPQVTEQTP